MKFSALMKSETYRPNPTARASDRGSAIKRLVVAAHKDIEEAILEGHIETAGQRESIDLNSLLKEIDGELFERKERGKDSTYVAPKIVEDFRLNYDDPDTVNWINEYFNAHRSYGPRAARKRQSSGGSEKYRALRNAVENALVVKDTPKATKQELLEALEELLETYNEYGKAVPSLKNTTPDAILEDL